MILIDDFMFDLTEDFGEADFVMISNPGWMGPQTAETEAARIQGLKDAWIGNDERRLEHSARLKKHRYNGPTHQNGISGTHRANLSKSQMGNQNARKKPK